MITNNISTLKIHKLTQAQYERELAAGRIDENAIYLTPDEEGGSSEEVKVELKEYIDDEIEDVKTEIKAYVDEAILGGEW